MRAYLTTPLIGLALALAVAVPTPAAARGGAPIQKEDKSAKDQKAIELAKSAKQVVWHDPGAVESLDFTYGIGGAENAPKPPFKFVEEDLNASNPKVKVTDANGRKWTAKFGGEVNAEVFASRIAWAAGYYVEPGYFVPSGKIEGVDQSKLSRAKKFIGKDGSFTNARFEYKPTALAKLNDEQGWDWRSNPFVGTKELNGLKVVMMLTSNWDNKDVRDISRGSNTAIYVVETPEGNEARYYITDWGGSMGKWGGVLGREKWDPKGYAKQSADFLKVSGGTPQFGYSGQHTGDWKNDIKPSDVAWITQYLARITDDQIRTGLQAAGATEEEISILAPAVRQRIDALKQVH
jgi:hypothetical protein